MRIEHTNNNTVDITFDPSQEGLCLLDFVLVEEGKERYLGQIVELSDYKFDAGLNIAKVQILYKINDKNEIVSYDGYTPTRTCTISICNQKEIEDYICEGKKTVELSINPKTMLPLKLNLNFFNNKPVILADKMDDFNLLSSNLAHILSDYKNVIIFDYTGSLDIEDSARLRASIDFKLPLDYETINFVWEESMKEATIEVQAACDDIFNEVKSYLKTLRGKSIPYNLFLKTIIDSHKKNKNSALWYLRNKLVKYFDEQIFAQDIKDIELLSKTVKDNKITVIDFSNLDVNWHRKFCEFILRAVKEDVYLFMRLNDSTSSDEIINKIYGKTQIKVIPSVSYGYKKLPSISENFNNYIFLSTLSPIRNYGIVNPSILSLDANYALLYGEDTKELIFKIQNTISIDEEIKARKRTKKIELESFNKTEDNLDEFEEVNEIPNRIVVENDEEVEEKPQVEEIAQEAVDTKEDNSDMSEFQKQFNDETLKEELFSTPSEEYVFEDVTSELEKFENQENFEYQNNDLSQEEETEEIKELPELDNEDRLEESFQSLFDEPEDEKPVQEITEQELQEQQEATTPFQEIEQEKLELGDNELDFYEDVQIQEDEIGDDIFYGENNQVQENNDEPRIIEEPIEDIKDVSDVVEDEDLYDDKLKAFLEDEPAENQEEIRQSPQEIETVEQQESNDDFVLENIGDDIVIEDDFAIADIENEEQQEAPKQSQSQEVHQEYDFKDSDYAQEENVYNVEEIEDEPTEEQEEIYTNIEETSPAPNKSGFEVGEAVKHDKYGIGKILEVIEYSNRTLLQIEFADIGKRLLDPEIANIKHLSNA